MSKPALRRHCPFAAWWGDRNTGSGVISWSVGEDRHAVPVSQRGCGISTHTTLALQSSSDRNRPEGPADGPLRPRTSSAPVHLRPQGATSAHVRATLLTSLNAPETPLPSQPATQADELLDRLVVVKRQPVLDEVELRRIERSARKLMRTDAVAAHGVLGGIAALRGEPDAVHNHFRVALQQAQSATVRLNYAVSLALLDLHGEALEVTTAALEHYPDDLDLLGHAIQSALQFASFGTARDLVDRWDVLVPTRPHPSAQLVQHGRSGRSVR